MVRLNSHSSFQGIIGRPSPSRKELTGSINAENLLRASMKESINRDKFPAIAGKGVDVMALTEKAKKAAFLTLESKLNKITSKEYNNMKINEKILDVISNPEMAKYPDFSKTHFKTFNN